MMFHLPSKGLLKGLCHDLRMCRIFSCSVDFLNCPPYWILEIRLIFGSKPLFIVQFFPSFCSYIRGFSSSSFIVAIDTKS